MATFSQFTELWKDVLDGLSGLHGVLLQFRQDETDVASPWRYIRCSKVELNAAEVDRHGRTLSSEGERQFGFFLIERQFLAQDSAGNVVLPDRKSVVNFNGHYYRAHVSQDKPCCYAEDHEGLLFRFRTTEQEVVE